jgi:hypothetical protein
MRRWELLEGAAEEAVPAGDRYPEGDIFSIDAAVEHTFADRSPLVWWKGPLLILLHFDRYSQAQSQPSRAIQ